MPDASLPPRLGRYLLPVGVFLAALLYILANAVGHYAQDEERYVYYAHNLLRGFYAPPDTLYIWNGPGYPLFLAPFVFWNIPLIFAKACNAIFLAAAAFFQYRTLTFYLPPRTALLLTTVFSLYAGVFGLAWLPLLMTEAICYFLISGGAYFLCRASRSSESVSYLWIAAAFFGYLALTKVFFGYVLVACAALCLGLRVFQPTRAISSAGFIFAGALLFCLPYLLYTYALTGRIFYWANSGGTALYTLSAPEPNLLGDIFPLNIVSEYPEIFPSQSAYLPSLSQLNHVEYNSALLREAVRNIRNHPLKALLNWRANLNRLIMDFPFSTFPGSHSRLNTGNWSLVYFPAFFLSLFLLFPTLLRWRHFPAEILILVGVLALSLVAFSLVSSYARFVYPLLPLLLLWLGGVWARALRIRVVPA